MFNITPKYNLENEFFDLAKDLMLKTILCTQSHQYYLAEIEFYLYHDQHQDDSTHRCERQKKNGVWYLHRYKNCINIKAGRRKGLDITFGNEEMNMYAGILIRALQNTKDEQDYIYGPSKVIDRMLEDSECDLFELEKDNIFSNQYLKIEDIDEVLTMDIISCPRFNLGKNTSKEYRELAYRFITFPLKQHIGKETLIIPYLKKQMKEEQILSLFNRKSI